MEDRGWVQENKKGGQKRKEAIERGEGGGNKERGKNIRKQCSKARNEKK